MSVATVLLTSDTAVPSLSLKPLLKTLCLLQVPTVSCSNPLTKALETVLFSSSDSLQLTSSLVIVRGWGEGRLGDGDER